MESKESERKRKEIQNLLLNIQDHFKRLEDYANIPSLELNVILSKISKLQEKTSVLKYLMSKKEEESFDDDRSSGSTTASDQTIENETDSSQQNGTDEIEENREANKLSSELDAEPKEELVEEEKSETNEVESHVDPAESSTGKGIGKMEDYLDLNAKFSGEDDHSLSDQLKKQPISNLLTAIGLNERYLFANQLFNGDMSKFIDEIKKLNSFQTEEEALDYFDTKLSNKDSWKSSEDLVEAFRLLIQRRFQES